MRFRRRAVVGASVAAAITAAAPARAATYRFRTTVQVQQDTSWTSSRDDVARGASSGCFGTSTGSGTQRITFMVTFTLGLRDLTIRGRPFLDVTLPRRFVHSTATITRNGQLTFTPAPGATQPCAPQTARTDGCGPHRYGLGMYPNYGRLYGTRGRNIEVLDIFSTIGPATGPFNSEPYDYLNPTCPYWGLLPSWDGKLEWNLDAAWFVIRTGRNTPAFNAALRRQYLPASRVHNRRVLRTVTRNGITLNERLIATQAFQTPTGEQALDLGNQDDVSAQTIQTVTWTLRRLR